MTLITPYVRKHFPMRSWSLIISMQSRNWIVIWRRSVLPQWNAYTDKESSISEFSNICQDIDEMEKRNHQFLHRFETRILHRCRYRLKETSGEKDDQRDHRKQNAIIKCVKKNANGYTNWERFRNRIIYVLNPKVTYSLYPIQNENKVAKSCSWSFKAMWGGVSTPTLLETQNFMTPRYFWAPSF